MKKLFAYCRVSTTQQKNNKNIEIQKVLIQKYQNYHHDDYKIVKIKLIK